MSEGRSQRSVASSAQHRQEAEVAAAEERERAAAETAVTMARAARLAMTELAAARAEVEVAVAADTVRAVAAELEALRDSSINISVSADGGTDNELKLAREAAREQVERWAAAHPQGRGRIDSAPGGGARGGRPPDGGGSLDRCGCADGCVDGDRGLYRRRGSPSPDRCHGHRGI
jgi:membrane protein involved in colicin uptake